jgi:hypothetical protein
MSTICSSARAVVAAVEEEEEEAVVEKAEAVAEVVAVEAVEVAAVEVEAVAPRVALEALAARMFPPRMDTLNVLDALDPLGTPGLLSTPASSCHLVYTSDLTIITVEVDLPAPTPVAQLVEEADPNHNTEAASSTAAARELLTPPVLEAL